MKLAIHSTGFVSQSTSQLNNTSDGGAGGTGNPGGGTNGTPPSGTRPTRPTTTTTTSGATTTTTTTSATGTTTTTTQTSGTDTTIGVALKSVRMVRSKAGHRKVKLVVKTTEAVTFTGTLSRGGKRLSRKTAKLKKGTHTLRIAIPDTTKAGAARLRLAFADSAGNTKRYTRARIGSKCRHQPFSAAPTSSFASP